MADLMDEVGDDLRRQQLLNFWNQNGPWIVGGALMAIVLTAALSFWRSYETGHDRRETTALLAAAKQGDAETFLMTADTVDTSHAMLARFTAAHLFAQQGKTDEALAVYKDIAATSRLSKLYRDLAQIFSATLVLNAEGADKAANIESVIADLKPLIADDSAWRFSALELSAVAKAKLGRTADAASDLTQIITDPAAPEGMRGRALSFHDLYATEQK